MKPDVGTDAACSKVIVSGFGASDFAAVVEVHDWGGGSGDIVHGVGALRDLGFASTELPSGRTVAIIDVSCIFPDI